MISKIVLRQLVLSFLQKETPPPIRLHELSKFLKIKSDSADYVLLGEVLEELIEENLVSKSTRRRFQIASQAGKGLEIEGVISIQNQSGVVKTSSAKYPLIQIRREHLHTALHGDTVSVILLPVKKQKAKHSGEVVQVLKRAHQSFSGTIEIDGNFNFFIPDDSKLHVDFLVHDSDLAGAKNGDKVLVQLLKWDDPYKSPEVKVIKILGKSGEATVEYDTIVLDYNLPEQFPDKVEQEAQEAAKKYWMDGFEQRLDIRSVEVITIDPYDAKDFDDALSLEKNEEGNLVLGVHIADVSHFVRERSLVDFEAQNRATSVYLVDRVVPMLPEILSNNVCSLVPNEDRLTYSVFIEFTPRGKQLSYKIAQTVINSKRRFTYEEVQEVIDNKPNATKDCHETVTGLHKLSTILRNKRYKTAGIDFETSEIKFILDENKNPVKAIKKVRTDATSLVEECMLMANKVVAEHIQTLSDEFQLHTGKSKKGLRTLPFMYRIHDEPDKEKFKNALGVVRSFGYDFPDKVNSKVINEILHSARTKPEAPLINTILLRSMAKAVYSETNIGHYGLGFEHYAHFTSPIRRYPDLIVHRMLKLYAKGIPSLSYQDKLYESMSELATHCSQQEVLATEAERASIRLTHAAIAKAHVGEKFSGTISGVTQFGVFVVLDELLAEGLIKIRELDSDYYFFEERKHMLIGKRTKKVFRLGGRVKVQISKVNMEKREIDLRFLHEENRPFEKKKIMNDQFTRKIENP